MSKVDQLRGFREKRAAKSSRSQRAPQPPGTALPVTTETASDKGKAENGPTVRRRAAKPGALAPVKGATQRADRAAPAVLRETKPKRKAKKPAKKSAATKPKVGRPRTEDRGKTLSDTKPWLKENPPVSRATYYRRQGQRTQPSKLGVK